MKKRQKIHEDRFYRKSATIHYQFIAIFHMANVVFPNNTFKSINTDKGDNPDKL